MRLLLTRTEPGATASAERLRRLGHDVIVEPMLRIEHLAQPSDLPAPAALVLTSANGVRALSSWPASLRWHDLPVFVIGATTAEACRSMGYSRVRSANGNADALFALVERELDPRSGTILYAVAEITATDLQGRLSRHGYSVHRVAAYRANPAPILSEATRAAIANSELDAILFYSERAAAIFALLVEQTNLAAAFGALDLIALSPEVARPLAVLPARRRLVANRPDEDALFACLQ